MAARKIFKGSWNGPEFWARWRTRVDIDTRASRLYAPEALFAQGDSLGFCVSLVTATPLAL